MAKMATVDKSWMLFIAAKIGDKETVKSILHTKEVYIETIINGETALHVATTYGHENVVKFLFDKSKSLLSMKDMFGRTPLHIAVYQGNLRMVEIICHRCTRVINDKDGQMKSPLSIAVSKNHPEIVKSLLEHGATFMNEPYHYDSIVIFHMAIQDNYKSIVKILLPRVKVVDFCSCPVYPDLEFAKEIFDYLLEKQVATAGSYFNRIDHQLAFSFASFYNREYQVKRLVETGANVNVRDNSFRMTALEHSIVNKNVSMVEYLISKMAGVNGGYWYNDRHSKRPLHYSSLQLYTPCVKQKEFEDSCQIMEILLKNCASVNVFNHEYKTPLHCAVEEDKFRPEKIRLLLHYGADVNAHLNKERTPIFFAKCEAILQMLIDYGANVNHKWLVRNDTQHRTIMTPLHLAIMRGDLPKVYLLLENGAEIIEPSRDVSMIYILRQHNIPELTETIIDGLKDVRSVIKTLLRDYRDDKNIIPILVKRHLQGEVIITNSKEFVSPSGLFHWRIKECHDELVRMLHAVMNHNLKLNLFNFLCMPIAQLIRYVKNQVVLNVFESGTIQHIFPVYSGMLMRRFNKAKEDRQLIDSSSAALQNIIFRSHKIRLTHPLADRIIVNFLHTIDRKKLLEL